jgi:hypothetical protein
MVPTLLRFLDQQEYLFWIVFTTIGGLTLQLEASLQTLLVRRAAREHAATDRQGFAMEARRAVNAYRTLAVAVAFIIMPLAWWYMADAIPAADDVSWQTAWIVFGGAYAINFSFGPNNVLLLATHRHSAFFLILAISRALGFVATVAALAFGLALLGAAAAFATTVMLNIGAVAWVAHRTRQNLWSTMPAPLIDQAPEDLRASPAGLVRFTLFSLAGYGLYRGAVMLAIVAIPAEAASGYGLLIQTFAVIGAVAGLPLQTRLAALASAVVAGDRKGEAREMAFGLVFAMLAVAVATAFLCVAGNPLLELLESRVTFPSTGVIVLAGLAFAVEAAIMVFVNHQIIVRQMGFIRGYVVCVLIGLGLASIILATSPVPVPIALLVVPLLVQACASLPIMAHRIASGRGQSLSAFLVDLKLACADLLANRRAFRP